MKKFLTLLAALACTAALNAATLNWSVSQMSEYNTNNYALDGVTISLNDNLSLSFANAEATTNNYIRYRKVTAMPEPGIAFYSNNEITLTATDATITSVQFLILTDEAAGNDGTPGWKFTVNGSTLSGSSDTWTGSESSLLVVGGSKATITGLVIEYTPENESPSTPEDPGEESEISWLASELTDVANNEQLDGKSFDINDYLSFSIADNASDKDAIFKKTSSAPTTINLYSQNSITFTAAEGVTINSIQFIVNTSEGTSNTPGWNLQDEAKNSYTADNDTWTGNASTVTFTDKSAVQLKGFVINYTTPAGENPGGGDEPDEPETPSAPDNTLDFQTAELFFSADQVGQGAIAQNVTLSDNKTSVDFTTTSTSAQIDASNGYFGTAEDYITIPYRYRPGGKSSNGINSDNKGVFTFPCPGKLTIYAYNNQSDDRNLQLIQNDVTILDHVFQSTDVVNVTNPNRNVYPIVDVEVGEGTAYLLWPVNQVMLFGFKFEPVVTTITEGSIIVGGGTVLDQTSQSAVIEDGTLVISTEKETVWAYIQVPESATAVYYKLSNVKSNKNGRQVAPEGFQTAMPYEGYWVAPLKLNTNGTLEVQYEDEEGNLSPVSQFNYKVILNTPTGIEEVVECLPAEDGIIYNIFGQKVDESYKGIVIKNGKKYIQK